MPVRKIIGVTTIALFLSLTLFSCNNDSPTGPSSDSIVGKWILKNLSMHVQIKTGGIQITKDTAVAIPTNDMYLDLRADKTYTFMFDPSAYLGGDASGLLKKRNKQLDSTGTDEGTWSLSGSNLLLKDSDTTITMPISLNGNDLTSTMKLDVPLDSTMSIKADISMNFKR